MREVSDPRQLSACNYQVRSSLVAGVSGRRREKSPRPWADEPRWAGAVVSLSRVRPFWWDGRGDPWHKICDPLETQANLNLEMPSSSRTAFRSQSLRGGGAFQMRETAIHHKTWR